VTALADRPAGAGTGAAASLARLRADRRAAVLERFGDRVTRAFAVLVFAFLFLPIVVVVVYSFNAGRHVSELTGFSTRWYESAWGNRFVIDALRRSLTIATATAVLATILGTASALALDSLPRRVRAWFELLTYVAIIVPGIVIGIATLIFLVLAFEWLGPWLRFFLGEGAPRLGLGSATIVAAHTLFTSAIVHVLVRTRITGMDRALIEASEDLYATPVRTFWQVTFPQLLPAIVSGTSSSRSSPRARTRRSRSTCSPRSGAVSPPRSTRSPRCSWR
jgi:spermidine/putrescine transport system permease protein